MIRTPAPSDEGQPLEQQLDDDRNTSQYLLAGKPLEVGASLEVWTWSGWVGGFFFVSENGQPALRVRLGTREDHALRRPLSTEEVNEARTHLFGILTVPAAARFRMRAG